ncbi:MAG: DUF87 domain-containing protein [Actinomycetota bacterium]
MASDQDRHLWLGGAVDPATHERTGQDVGVDTDDLTTHGVIVGMTGSGKTGLGIILLEEALLEGIPCLVLDPKGDMANLLLTFPELAADDFAPWVQGDDDPADVAETWRSGLEGWGIDGARIAAMRERSELAVYTPGSTAAQALDIVGDLSPPPEGTDPEAVADQIESYVSGLLALVDIDADPLASREHILLSNLIDHAWSSGEALDLGRLVSMVQQPPIRKLGVIDLDTFFPAEDRVQLALRLNGLLASPSFAAWAQGVPLDIERLLWPDGSTPAAAILSLAHLSDSERQFVVSLVLSQLVTWMRAQPGSDDLRVLVYMDEVMGFVPPSAAPPAKRPILTILKQARAYGVGMVLSTQNPVDLDYKAISNAGTWLIGRLQTERDRDRLLDGMTSASGAVDRSTLAETISGLAKREFLLHQTSADTPTTMTTRWAMSYLAGPLTKAQLGELERSAPDADGAPAEVPAAEPTGPAAPALADDETDLPPEAPSSVEVRHVAASAPWVATVGGDPSSGRYQPGLAVTVDLLYDDTKADLRHTETYEAVVFPIGDGITPEDLHEVDHDERDLLTEAAQGARFVLADVDLGDRKLYTEAKRTVADTLYRQRTVTIWRNAELKLWSRVNEDRETFAARCRTAAEDHIDDEADVLRQKLDKQRDKLVVALRKAEDRVRELDADLDRNRNEGIGDVAGALLGSLLGGRRRTRSLARSMASKQRSAAKTRERLDTALNRQLEKEEALVELEQDLADGLTAIEDEWLEHAEAIEEVDIPLDKSDIDVRAPVLIWVPSAD